MTLTHAFFEPFYRMNIHSSATSGALTMSKNKIVLITGATAGIGRTTALHLAKLGHHVIATGRKVGELAKLKEEASALGYKLDSLVLDVTSPASIAAAVGGAEELTLG